MWLLLVKFTAIFGMVSLLYYDRERL